MLHIAQLAKQSFADGLDLLAEYSRQNKIISRVDSPVDCAS